jgi:rhodanese-related sulfurtransferase
MSQLKSVAPHDAARLLREGAVLIDIREADEHARERIAGARHHALSKIDSETPARAGDDVLIFHCRSGMRTKANAEKLTVAAQECDAYVLEGGIDGWKKAGLPVAVDHRQPIEIMRQVQIGAGGLVLTGILLGAFVNPLFYLLSGFVGAGLLFAGITGFCGMANVLALMPWNRKVAA